MISKVQVHVCLHGEIRTIYRAYLVVLIDYKEIIH